MHTDRGGFGPLVATIPPRAQCRCTNCCSSTTNRGGRSSSYTASVGGGGELGLIARRFARRRHRGFFESRRDEPFRRPTLFFPPPPVSSAVRTRLCVALRAQIGPSQYVCGRRVTDSSEINKRRAYGERAKARNRKKKKMNIAYMLCRGRNTFGRTWTFYATLVYVQTNTTFGYTASLNKLTRLGVHRVLDTLII